MSMYTLGIEYAAAMRGQLITKQEINGLERMHLLKLHYSPIEYAQLYIGAGMDRMEVRYEAANRHFNGRYGIAPTAGLTLNSPALVRSILRVTANLDFLHLNSKDGKGYTYRGTIVDPSLGLIAHAGSVIDIEAGARGHFIAGAMTDPLDKKYPFSNVENLRGYFNFTLCSPTGAFAQFHFDASRAASSEFENGPVDATIGVSLGVLITSDETNKQLRERGEKYFPEFEDMKKKKRKMKEQIKE